MAANPDRLLAVLWAAGFTTYQLDSIAGSALGIHLAAITQETDPVKQALVLVDYATRYDLIVPLTTSVLDNSCDRPAVQNLLLGEASTMTTGSNEGQQGSVNYIMLRLEAKVDQILSEQSRQAQQVQQIAQSSLDAHRRLDRMEAGAQKPLSGMDRLIVLMLMILMVGLMAFTVYGALRP